MDNFHRIQKNALVYPVLMNLMKYLHRINEHAVCRLLDDSVAEAKRLTNALVKKLNNNQATSDDKTFRVMQEISYCRLIARNHDYVRGKPDLIASLVNAFRTTKLMLQITSED